jgi:hypothetical protein
MLSQRPASNDERESLPLTDMTLETSEVIQHVLSLADATWLPAPTLATLGILHKIHLFAHKWDCPLLARLVESRLTNFVHPDNVPSRFYVELFILVANLDLLPIAVHLIGPTL